MPFLKRQEKELTYHVSSLLAEEPGTRHGFSTRLGGVSGGEHASLNLRTACGDSRENVLENYRRLSAALDLAGERAVLARQVHGDAVLTVTEADAGKGLLRPADYQADALVTDVPGLPLFVFSADCIVILLSEAERGCVGAVHAGWRGTAKRIVQRTAAALAERYGARPENIRAAIGPGIGQCCFETDDDVPQAMLASMGRAAEPCLIRAGEKWRVDLKALNRLQLMEAGVPAGQIDVSPLCTACHPELYWSHRRMGESRGVQGAVIQRVLCG